MAVGSGGIGSFGVGSTVDFQQEITAVDALQTRGNEMVQSRWLEFWELTTPTGSIYFVDFVDLNDGASLPNLVAYNGQEYRSLRVGRGDIRESPDGHRSDVSVEVVDPDDLIMLSLNQHDGLAGEKLKVEIIPEDMRDQPELALKREWVVIDAAVRINPNSAVIRAGLTDVMNFITPRFKFSSRRCLNDYQDRFDLNNWCIYPSDRIQEATAQNLTPDLVNDVDTETPRKFGWFLRNSTKSGGWDHGRVNLASFGFPEDERWASGENDGVVNAPWLDAAQDGPFAYKKVPFGAVGIQTELNEDQQTDAADWFCGLLVFDTTTSNWVIWGLAKSGGVELLRYRSTVGNVSTDSEATNSSNHVQFWLERLSDGSFKARSRLDETQSWTDSGFGSSPSMSGTLQCGLVISTDTLTDPPKLIRMRFRNLIFTSGGFTTCNRSFADCQERANEHQFNAFRGMPLG